MKHWLTHCCQYGKSAPCSGHAGCVVLWVVWGEDLSPASWCDLQQQTVQISAYCEQRRTIWKLDLAWDVSRQVLCCWIQCQGKVTDSFTHFRYINQLVAWQKKKILPKVQLLSFSWWSAVAKDLNHVHNLVLQKCIIRVNLAWNSMTFPKVTFFICSWYTLLYIKCVLD